MNHVRLALASTYAITALVACAEEIPTEEASPEPTTWPTSDEFKDASKRLLDAGTSRKIPTEAGTILGGDAGHDAPDLGCNTFSEQEPNTEDSPNVLSTPAVCGALTAGDVDVFETKKKTEEATLRFFASGDAELEIRGFGGSEKIASGGEITIPKFPIQLGFKLFVSSPSGTPQDWHIVYP